MDKLLAALAGFVAAKVITPQQEQTIQEYVARGASTMSAAIASTSAYDQDIYYDDCVYLDATATGGTVFPYGTRRYPCKTLAQARTVCAARGLNKIFLVGNMTTYTLDADMTDYIFITDSCGNAALNLNGNSVDNSYFINVSITGEPLVAGTDAILSIGGILATITNPIQITGWNNYLTGAGLVMATGTTLVNSVCGIEGTPVDIYCGGALSLNGITGNFQIRTVDCACDICDIYGLAHLTINADCTAGNIYLRGMISVTGAGGGVTVNNYSVRTDIDTILTRLSAARAGYLDELGAANLPADIDTLIATRISQVQAPITATQAAPVQNTWYTVLDTTVNCRIYAIGVRVATTGETLEIKLTIDGQTFTTSQAATAGTIYYLGLDLTGITFLATTVVLARAFLYEGRSVKVEIRKTTNNGVGDLTGWCNYAKL